MPTAERACDDIDVLISALEDDYVDGIALRSAITALRLAHNLIETLDEDVDGDEDTRVRDDRKARFRELCRIPEGLWDQMREWK